MRVLTIAVAATLGLGMGLSGAALAQEGDKQPEGDKKAAEARASESRQVAPLQAREVIERLKTMRAQLLLEQEYNRLLEARVERMELEAQLGGAKSQSPASTKLPSTAARGEPRSSIGPPPRLENATDQLVVKAVTVAPFKEAIVTYRGRVYTVRPGDKLGDIEIRDILESGVVTSGGGLKSSVMLGQ